MFLEQRAAIGQASSLTDLVTQRIAGSAANLRRQWFTPTPGTTTRHAVLDNLLPPGIAAQVHADFPQDRSGFTQRNSFRERKWQCMSPRDHSPLAADALYAIQDPAVVALVAQITGMAALEPDPLLMRGGLSMMTQGNFLNPHIDNSHGPDPTRYRRLNLLYYVTPDWAFENGGNLELWDSRVRHPVTLESRFNRLVIMETNKTSWHSVSPVVADRARCCVSNYYFSPQSPDGSDYYHVTSFSARPGQYARRLLAPIDNAARAFAKRRLHMCSAAERVHAAKTVLS